MHTIWSAIGRKWLAITDRTASPLFAGSDENCLLLGTGVPGGRAGTLAVDRGTGMALCDTVTNF